MKLVTDKIDAILLKERLEPYYTSPRFHTSIAWVALEPSAAITPALASSPPPTQSEVAGLEKAESTSHAHSTDQESTVTANASFGPKELEELEQKLGKRLRDEELWAAELCLKIGKDVYRFPLFKSKR